MTNPKPKGIVLLSGGIDSTTTLALAQRQGFEVYALTFRYGQRHQLEVEAARRIAGALRAARHEIIDLDLRRFGGSALTDDIAVPKDRTRDEIAGAIPVTYVPARNTIFLAFALAWAEVLGAADIFVGVNALDYSGYPDCRPAVCLRFSGCTLWSGREPDRPGATCGFCDTDFVGTDGPGGGRFASPRALALAVSAAWPHAPPTRGQPFVVCTGGEPLLQL